LGGVRFFEGNAVGVCLGPQIIERCPDKSKL
jgi:hypothetical protein